jgi:hypothetical protein
VETNSGNRLFENKFLKQAEFYRFGIVCVLVTIVGCLGGAAVGLGAVKSTLALSFVIIPTMVTLSLLLAVSAMKQILISASLCILIDLALILYYVLD